MEGGKKNKTKAQEYRACQVGVYWDKESDLRTLTWDTFPSSFHHQALVIHSMILAVTILPDFYSKLFKMVGLLQSWKSIWMRSYIMKDITGHHL